MVSLEHEKDFQALCPYTTKPGTPEWEEHMVQHMSKEQTAALWKHAAHSGASRHTSESCGVTLMKKKKKKVEADLTANHTQCYHALRSFLIEQNSFSKFLCNLLVYQYRHAEVEQTEH